MRPRTTHAPPGPGFRIPRTFVPSSYRAHLAVDDAATSFTASIQIAGELAEASPVIWLHATELVFAKATASRGTLVVDLDPWPVEPEYVALVSDHPLDPGKWVIHIEYRGTIANQERIDPSKRNTWQGADATHGAFREVVDGAPYVFTQFEAMDARRVFPCIDEPDDKVPWQLTLDVRKELVVASNTPIARESAIDARHKRVEFAQTLPLPSYLVAFAIGPFDVVEAGRASGGVPIRILTQRGFGSQIGWAVTTTPRILDLVEDYVGIPYAYGKLDIITVPQVGNHWSAMENAGMITVVASVAIEASTLEHRQWWVEMIAHELAHHWFGDLVTARWWNDIWLNESFAVWLARKTVARFDPSWHLDEEAAGQRLMSRYLDAPTVRPPLAETADRTRLPAYFSGRRGALAIEMLESYLGDDVLRRALGAYLAKHAHGSATTEDLVAALDETSGRKLDEIVASAVDRNGLPTLRFEVSCGARPKARFTSNDVGWTMPVCFAYDRDGKRDDACALVEHGTAEVALPSHRCPRWIAPHRDGAGMYHADWTPALATPVVERAWRSLTPRERAVTIEEMRSRISDETRVEVAFELLDAEDVASVTWALREVADVARFVPVDLQSRFGAWTQKRFGAEARATHLRALADDDTATSARKAATVALVALTNDRELAEDALRLVADDDQHVDHRFAESTFRLAARADARVAERLLLELRDQTPVPHRIAIRSALADGGPLLEWLAVNSEKLAEVDEFDRVLLLSHACDAKHRKLVADIADTVLPARYRGRPLAAIDECIATRKRLEHIIRRAFAAKRI